MPTSVHTRTGVRKQACFPWCVQLPLFLWQLAVLIVFAVTYAHLNQMKEPLASLFMQMRVSQRQRTLLSVVLACGWGRPISAPASVWTSEVLCPWLGVVCFAVRASCLSRLPEMPACPARLCPGASRLPAPSSACAPRAPQLQVCLKHRL